MNHHRIKPRPAYLRRERDYVLYEKSHFFRGVAHALKAWQPHLGHDVVTNELIEALEKGNAEAIDEQRALTQKRLFDLLRLSEEEKKKTTGLVLLLDALKKPIIAEAKEADSYTTERRIT